MQQEQSWEAHSMKRRQFLVAAGAALACPKVGTAESVRTLRVVPYANVSSIDPIATSAYFARNHGFMVYDTLYGWNDRLEPEPQMAAGHLIENDGKWVTITLRSALRFHDGEPVRAIDAVVSLKRWMQRNPYGQRLVALVDDLLALDDMRLQFRLRKPFPLLIHGLGAIDWPCIVMPERIARTDAAKLIDDPTGSGPFRFKKDEYNSGSLIVYERNPAYVPVGSGTPSLTAGPKNVYFDRIELHVISDSATATAALQTGEIDWVEQVRPEVMQMLRRNRNLKVEPIGLHDNYGALRLNHLQPPFNAKAIRQAIWPAVDQSSFMQALMGADPEGWRGDVGVFPVESSMMSDAGLEPLRSPRSIEVARRRLGESGYSGEKVVLLSSAGTNLAPLAHVAADVFGRVGFNLEVAELDLGAIVQRRNSMEPVSKGGWSITAGAPASFGFIDPAVHQFIRGDGEKGLFGWPKAPRLEELRNAWFDATDIASRKAIAAAMQEVAIEEVTYVPLGSYRTYTALKGDLSDRVTGLPIFWGIRRSA
jgi:peptide/nickel transport system substrate-binding protein